MNFEKELKYSEDDLRRGRLIAKKMQQDRMTMPQATKQILTNESITHEEDVIKIMRRLGPIVAAAEEQLTDEAEVFAMLKEEKRAAEEGVREDESAD